MTEYTEIRIAASAALSDDISAVLCEAELAFQEADQTTLDPPPPGQVRFHLFVPPPEAAEVLALLHEQLDLPPGAITTAQRDEAEWRDTWKRYFTTRRIGRIAIVPSWEATAHQAQPGEVTLHLDPGRAFGTGGHASTRLCLRFIDRVSRSGSAVVDRLPRREGEVLDVGCGCGVLAIAALRCGGYARAVAIDIDPEAVEVTQENAERNGVTAQVSAEVTPLGMVPGRFPLVLANITGPTIHNLAEALAAHVAPGGSLVLAGILTTEAAAIVDRFASLGLAPTSPDGELAAEEHEDEWAALHLQRRAPAA